MNNLDQDKHIAAASLLALVSSENRASPIPTAIPGESEKDKAIVAKTEGSETSEKCKVNRKETTSPAPTLSYIKKRYDQEQRPSKVSEDESSPQQNVSRQSPFKNREVSCSRRHSYPLAATSIPSTSSTSPPVSKSKAKKSSKTRGFPQLLMEALSNVDYSDTMTFLPNNNDFIIIKNERFSEEIMPRHFKMTKFGCFLNKLGRWGFSHTMMENSRHSFSHPYFRKNSWDLLQFVTDTSLITDSSSLPSSSPSPLNQMPYSTKQRAITRKRKSDRSSECANTNQQAKCHKSWQQNKLPIHSIPTNNSNNASILQSSLARQLEMSRQLEERILFNSLHGGNPSLPLHCSTLSQSSSTITNCSSLDSTIHDVQNVTKDIVAKAIDSLLHDENHTLDLIARRGQEIHSRRLSLPGTSTSTFGNSWGSVDDGGFHHLSQQSSGLNFIP